MDINANNRLLHIRTKVLKLSQKELSKALDINQSVVSKSEDPNKNISLMFLFNLQSKYNINATWVLTGVGSMYINDNNDDFFHAKLLSLSKYDLDFIDEYLSLSEKDRKKYQAFLSSFNAMVEDIEDGD